MSKPTYGAGQSHTLTNHELLIKNLRLLDLDEEFDWPNVEKSTFAAADPIQNQKRRVYCAEWILYKLFEIWNQEDVKVARSPLLALDDN